MKVRRSARKPQRSPHYYFEKYECLDGEGEYSLMTVRQTSKPLKEDEWLREFIDFSVSTNDEDPWSKRRIKEWLADEHRSVDVYGGIRIYRNFGLREISKEEFVILDRFIR